MKEPEDEVRAKARRFDLQLNMNVFKKRLTDIIETLYFIEHVQ